MANVPMMENGSARLGITVAETLRRNRKITITTRPSVSSMVNCTSLYDSRMVSERSYKISMFTEAGISARNVGSRFLTRVGHFDGVGAGLALDAENDGALRSLRV